MAGVPARLSADARLGEVSGGDQPRSALGSDGEESGAVVGGHGQ
jgi:hypothetical protein